MSAPHFTKSPSPVDEEVTCLEAELAWRKKVAAEVREQRRREVEEAWCQEEEERKAQEEVKRCEEEARR